MIKECKMLIGGKWVDSESGKTFMTVNPTTGEDLVKVPLSDERDVDKAVKAARAAFPVWSKLPQADRTKYLNKMAAAIRERAEEFANWEMLEHGTRYKDALHGIMIAAEKFEYNASIALSVMGTHIPMEAGKLSYFRREPFGVAALIIPWNIPVMMMAVKTATALAVGNTCVIKPPSINSMTCLIFAEIINSVGVPDGVINIITGPGGSVGKALASHPEVDIIGFTGSSETGKEVLKYASATVKKCVMELGGNNASIVMEDADLEAAAKALGQRQFHNCGQHCSSTGRYYVHEKVYDAFLEKLADFARTRKVGDPKEDSTFTGPASSKTHQTNVENYIKSAVEEGATIYFAQEKEEIHKKGFFVMPTVISNVTHNMKIAREEVFGPVAIVIKYTYNDDLMALINDSRYGLCAHIWTGDIRKGLNMVPEIQAGSVYINCWSLSHDQSWGTNVKESGLGKEGGVVGLAEFTDLKMVTVDYNL